MPRNVRNAWATVSVDGIEKCATGPVKADGRLSIKVLYRENGCIAQTPFRLEVWPSSNGGMLHLELTGPKGMTQEMPFDRKLDYTLDVKR